MHTQSQEIYNNVYLVVEFTSYPWLNSILSENWMASNNNSCSLSLTVFVEKLMSSLAEMFWQGGSLTALHLQLCVGWSHLKPGWRLEDLPSMRIAPILGELMLAVVKGSYFTTRWSSPQDCLNFLTTWWQVSPRLSDPWGPCGIHCVF